MSTTARKIITSQNLFKSGLPYSPAVLVDKTLYLSGQIGWNKEGVMPKDIEGQTKGALENLGHVLKAAGADHSNIVKVSVLLADLNDFEKMNSAYAPFFKVNPPARAAYQVAKLPMGALVEIEAIAIVGDIITA